jgi:hypothetical protein
VTDETPAREKGCFEALPEGHSTSTEGNATLTEGNSSASLLLIRRDGKIEQMKKEPLGLIDNLNGSQPVFLKGARKLLPCLTAKN